MEGYSTEEETLAALGNWWKKNGRFVLSGVVIAALVVGGWKFWGYWQAEKAAKAASLYAAVVHAERQGDTAAIAKAARVVIEAYPDSAYGALAGLALAKSELQGSHYEAAASALRQVMANSPDRGIAEVARLRLARVQIENQKASDALKTLAAPSRSGSFAAAVDKVRGDAYAALHEPEKASEEYRKALAESDPASGLHRLLAMRIASLPVAATAVEPIETAPAASAQVSESVTAPATGGGGR